MKCLYLHVEDMYRSDQSVLVLVTKMDCSIEQICMKITCKSHENHTYNKLTIISFGQSIPISIVLSTRPPSGSGLSSSLRAGICEAKLDILRLCFLLIPLVRAIV